MRPAAKIGTAARSWSRDVSMAVSSLALDVLSPLLIDGSARKCDRLKAKTILPLPAGAFARTHPHAAGLSITFARVVRRVIGKMTQVARRFSPCDNRRPKWTARYGSSSRRAGKGILRGSRAVFCCCLGAVRPVDRHIVVAEVGCPDGGAARTQAEFDAHVDFDLGEALGGVGFSVGERLPGVDQL